MDATLKKYEAFPFEFILIDADSSRGQSVKLSFDNVDRTIVDALRRAKHPMQIQMGVGLVIDVDLSKTPPEATSEGYEVYLMGMDLVNVSWNAQTVSGTLTKDNVLTKAFPSNHPIYDHTNFPGLYGVGGLP